MIFVEAVDNAGSEPQSEKCFEVSGRKFCKNEFRVEKLQMEFAGICL